MDLGGVHEGGLCGRKDELPLAHGPGPVGKPEGALPEVVPVGEDPVVPDLEEAGLERVPAVRPEGGGVVAVVVADTAC